uniref:RUN and SH3 domain containing 2 n=1 Tax=Pelusios castaneus TaxID=367368 RepID=A0A8C8RWE4_9SAUR
VPLLAELSPLAGETLIVHHIPLVHCQVPDRQCCSGSARPNPFCQPELGIPHTASLPERALSQTDSLVYSSLLHTSEAPAEAAEDAESKARDFVVPGVNKRHNPFLLSRWEGHDRLSDNAGQQSFHLHSSMASSKPAFHLRELALPPFHLHDASQVVKPWSMAGRSGVVDGQEDKLTSADVQKRNNINRCHLAAECMQLEECSCQRRSFSFEGAEQDWNSSDGSGRNQDTLHSRTCSCSSTELQPCRCGSTSSQSEPGDQQMGYVSDSSCNSSDGVLVNFSALYNKMNGHSRSNLNSANLSCDSSCSRSDTGAFYLDLHSSPTESRMSCDSHNPENSGKVCGCHHPSSPVLDANCNSCHLHCEPCPSEGSDLTACFQSQARLVLATQNYYKLVTCDLSSQSSPSPAGSSFTSCSEEHTRGSPVQPTEYYLFRRPDAQPEESDAECFTEGEAGRATIEGQVYVNVSPPNLSAGRPRSRSYDRNLDRSPGNRLSLERMLSCPVKLSESPALAIQSSPPKRVTSFAELAKGRKKNGSPPLLRASGDSSLEFSPIPEIQQGCPSVLEDRARRSQSLPPMPFGHCLNRSCDGYRVEHSPRACPGQDSVASKMPCDGHGAAEQASLSLLLEAGASLASGHGQRDARVRVDGAGVGGQGVVRYSKEQRPTTLPIQPFVFQHHFKPAKTRPLHGHFAAGLAPLCSLPSSRPAGPHASASAPSGDQPGPVGAASLGDGPAKAAPAPESTRPSPLGSYSPVRGPAPFLRSLDSSPSPERAADSRPPSATQPARASRAASPEPLPSKEAPSEHGGPVSESRPHGSSGAASLSRALGLAEPQWRGSGEAASVGTRPLNANHLSPQALKWREYRRRNPLGLDRGSGPAGLAGSLDRKQQEPGLARRNPIFEFPASLNPGHGHCRLNGQPVKQLQLSYTDFFPEYFSLAEKPPAEFCLSPDGNAESISIDLLQKKGLVKAINTAVDLIVAHFGTSRDPGVKAKLGNSSVSPNVGHLILKYLCPAIRDILSDGLKAYVLDMIIGQRKNTPWSVVEASTQLGPSTKVLHSLHSKISQYAELTSPSMRFNAFIFGLLNIRSLEFWFNHLYTHEDIILAHYQPVGFLCLSHGVCQPLLEELLLLLQPLSLLPFSLDLLFEHHLLQMGREQELQKELLRVKQDLLLSAHSTLQLMRTRGGGEDPDGWSGAACERAKGVGASCGEGAREEELRKAKEGAGEGKKDKQAGWWYQLMQSSQVYIEGSAEGSKFVRHEKKKVAAPGAVARLAEGRKVPPPREGVVEGAEACPVPELAREERPRAGAEPGEKRVPAGEGSAWSWPSWMGSPPDSVLTELKRSKERDNGALQRREEAAPPPGESSPGAPDSGQPVKWGHLFGARKAQKEARQPNRMPSGWLTLDRSVFQLLAQTMGTGMWREVAPEPKRPQTELPSECPASPSPPPPVVKALCHHIATEEGQLSFNKGDVLRVLAKVDGDWLQCSLGSQRGLVPIMYVTHPTDEDY